MGVIIPVFLLTWIGSAFEALFALCLQRGTPYQCRVENKPDGCCIKVKKRDDEFFFKPFNMFSQDIVHYSKAWFVAAKRRWYDNITAQILELKRRGDLRSFQIIKLNNIDFDPDLIKFLKSQKYIPEEYEDISTLDFLVYYESE